ncbi:MAG: hypothetical protein JSV65_19815 [Armatimonadota bacterium]|nr:MAG: hypothetical protein JSV65_19815 [Armatimonadota bacterium]
MKTSVISLALAIAAGLASVAPLPCFAADHQDLEEGLPTRVEDAYPHPYRAREVQAAVRYLNEDEGDLGELEIGFDYGAARNLQVSLAAPFLFGSGDRAGNGDVRLHALYNFNTETMRTPALSLVLESRFATGTDSEGTDVSAKAIMTRTIGTWAERVHVNIAYTDVGSPEPGDRCQVWFAGIGYDRPLSFDELLILDAFWEQSDERDGDDSIVVEVGVRSQLTPWSVLAWGASTALAGDAPDVTATIAYHYSF